MAAVSLGIDVSIIITASSRLHVGGALDGSRSVLCSAHHRRGSDEVLLGKQVVLVEVVIMVQTYDTIIVVHNRARGVGSSSRGPSVFSCR